MTEVYLLFYSHVLQYFVHLNLFLQCNEPIIGVIHEQVAINRTDKFTCDILSLSLFFQCIVAEVYVTADVKASSKSFEGCEIFQC